MQDQNLLCYRYTTGYCVPAVHNVRRRPSALSLAGSGLAAYAPPPGAGQSRASRPAVRISPVSGACLRNVPDARRKGDYRTSPGNCQKVFRGGRAAFPSGRLRRREAPLTTLRRLSIIPRVRSSCERLPTGRIAQLVEHQTENLVVPSSTLGPSTMHLQRRPCGAFFYGRPGGASVSGDRAL